MKKVKDIQAKVADKEKLQNANVAKKDNKSKELTKISNQEKAFNAKAVDYQQARDAASADYLNAESQVHQTQAMIDNLSKKKEQLQAELKSKQSELQQTERATDEVRGLLTQKKTEIEGIQNKIGEHKRNIEKNIKDMEKRKAEVQRHETAEARVESKLENVKQKLAEVKVKMNETIIEMSNLEIGKTQLQKVIDEHNKIKQELEQQKTQIEGEKRQLEQERVAIEKQIKAERVEKGKKDTQYKNKAKDIDAFEEKLDAQNQELMDLKSKESQADVRIRVTKRNETDMEQSIEDSINEVLDVDMKLQNVLNQEKRKVLVIEEKIKFNPNDYHHANVIGSSH